MRQALIAGMVIIACLTARGQRVVCLVEPETAFLGESIFYKVMIRDADNAECATPEVEGLTFKPVGSSIVNQRRSVTISGGRRRESTAADYMFTYEVAVTKKGTYRIPRPRVTVGGREMRGRECLLTVEEASSQDLARISMRAMPARILRGGSFQLIVDLEIRHLPAVLRETDPLARHDRRTSFFDNPTQAPGLYLPWLPQVPQGLSGVGPKKWAGARVTRRQGPRGLRIVDRRHGPLFSSSIRFVSETKDVDRPDSSGKSASYRRYTFKIRLTGEVVGRYAFDPATLMGQLVESSQSGRKDKAHWRRVFARSDPVTVVVEEAPIEGRPDTFTGALGNFTFKMDPPTPTDLELGQAIYLSFVVKGKGYLKGVDLDLSSQLGDAFRVVRTRDPIDSPEPGKEKTPGLPDRPGFWRQFDFKIYPQSVTTTAVPAIAFSWFDPEARKYVTANTKPVPITVKSVTGGATKVVVAPSARNRETVELVATATLSSNVDDLNLLGNQAPRSMPWLAIVVALPFLYGGLTLYVGRRRRLHADPALRRRLNARGVAGKRLAEARRIVGSDVAGALRQAEAACLGFVADLQNLEEAALTGEDLVSWVRDRSSETGALTAATQKLSEAVEALDFGGGPKLPEEARALLDSADSILELGRSRGSGGRVRASLWLCAVLILAPQLGAQVEEHFRSAQAAFTEGRIADAAQGFERVLEGGYENGYVLYNLGNCYLRLSRLGHAIAAYRRAERLLPGDANIKVNLQKALEARARPLSPSDERGVLDYILFWRRDLTFNSTAAITVALALLAFTVALVRMLLNRSAPALKWATALLLLAALLFGTSAVLEYLSYHHHDSGVVVATETVVRKGPGATFDPRYTTTVAEGAEFHVIARRSEWLKVLVGGEYEGWVSVDDVVTW